VRGDGHDRGDTRIYSFSILRFDKPKNEECERGVGQVLPLSPLPPLLSAATAKMRTSSAPG